MDKIVLTEADIEKLFAWKDNHLDALYVTKFPYKGIKVVIPHSNMELTYIYEDNNLKLTANTDGKPMGNVRFERMLFNRFKEVRDNSLMPKDFKLSAITLYCALSALSCFANTAKTQPKTQIRNTGNKSYRATVKKPCASHKTYILRCDGENACIVEHGHHASPRYAFSVRGHFRHYKNGNVVWIEQYDKGCGKKRKTYAFRKCDKLD